MKLKMRHKIIDEKVGSYVIFGKDEYDNVDVSDGEKDIFTNIPLQIANEIVKAQEEFRIKLYSIINKDYKDVDAVKNNENSSKNEGIGKKFAVDHFRSCIHQNEEQWKKDLKDLRRKYNQNKEQWKKDLEDLRQKYNLRGLGVVAFTLEDGLAGEKNCIRMDKFYNFGDNTIITGLLHLLSIKIALDRNIK